MKPPIRIYNQFDVVIVPFPFTDRQATKLRPALVISDASEFNRFLGRSVMAMITTASQSPWPLDVPIADQSTTGLKAASIVRMKLFTLDHALVIRKSGVLAAADQVKVSNVLQRLMQLG
jgi:mRNA interferase MazF